MNFCSRKIFLCTLSVFFILVTDIPVYAQNGSLSVTVTPTLFQLTIGPGESWSSNLKVVNNNDYDTTYSAEVMDFEANGEDGSAKYIPLVNETASGAEPYSLASWIEIPKAPLVIKAGHSMELPFSLHIPANAEPGGHYAAILVGSKPPNGLAGSGALISTMVSSLLFVRISGETVESGRIREFRATNSIYQEPKADFILRFENTGNTHLRPQGEITIYNMWGKERGKIEINQNTNFGNVLPKSIRKFAFSWEGEASFFDIGPYSAIVTLSYGDNGKKNITAKTYFWVIPTVPVVATLSTIALFLILLSWFVRRYIHRALELERRIYDVAPLEAKAEPSTFKTLIEPIREGVVDLRRITTEASAPLPAARRSTSETSKVDGITGSQFMRKYRLFFVFVLIVVVSGIIAYWYIQKALVQHRSFKIKAISAEVEQVK